MRRSFRALTSLAFLAFLAFSVVGHGTQVSVVEPRLACSVVRDPKSPPSSGPAIVGNLQRVELQATLTGPPETLLPLRLSSVGPPDRAAPAATLEITVRRITAADTRVPVTSVLTMHGLDQDTSEQSVMASLGIPLDVETRRQNIERYLSRLEAEAGKAGRLDEFKHLSQDRETTIKALDQMYLENAVGDYEVSCQYSAKGRGYWNGRVAAAPLRLRISYEGNFFDRLLR